MIPDDLFNFNQCSASSSFNIQEADLHQMSQQDAMPLLDIERHLLLVCPICKRPWYKAGQNEYPRLMPEQLVVVGAALQVDIQALYLLPKSLCTICSTMHLGGMFSAEVYPHHQGYRFLWESISPRRIQLVAIVCRAEGLSLDAFLQMSPQAFAEPIGEIRSVLAWVETCSSSVTAQALTDEQCQHLARRCPPGHTTGGRPCQWQGYAWETSCPLLGGKALVSLAVALPWQTLPPFPSLRFGWGVLARALRAVL